MKAANQLSLTGAKKKMSIPNQRDPMYEVVQIPLSYLYYNDQNGRINTAYKLYQSTHGTLEPTPGDSEYNKIFQDFIYNSNPQALKDTLISIKEKSQQQPAVVLRDGRVIDGNRRFTALRISQKEDSIPKNLEAIILPLDSVTDKKTIKALELDLQLGQEERVDYDPIDRIYDVYDTVKVKKLMNVEEYKKAAGAHSTKGINRDLRLADLILRFIGIISPGGNPVDKFYLAREMKLDGPIEEVENTLTKLEDSEKEAITEAVLVQLAISKTDVTRNDSTRVLRDVKTNILRNPDILEHYLPAVDEQVDNIIDTFQSHPINSARDLKLAVRQNSELRQSIKKFQKSTDGLVSKGKRDSKRKQALNELEDIRDQLDNLRAEDFKGLSTQEYQDSKDVLSDIHDIIFKLKKDL